MEGENISRSVVKLRLIPGYLTSDTHLVFPLAPQKGWLRACFQRLPFSPFLYVQFYSHFPLSYTILHLSIRNVET